MTSTEILAVTLLTARVSLVATAAILLPGVAVGFFLARARFRLLKPFLRTLVSLPMVLPPVAVGLLLLEALSLEAALGRAIEALAGGPVLLTWRAAAIAAAVMSFPLLVLGAEQGFASVPRRLEDVATTLGATRRRVFFRVTLPIASRGILYGLVFAFARGLGEFGATALVAGHIPGETETLSLAIYGRIREFRDADAAVFCAVSLLLAFATTFLAERFLKRERRP